MRTNLPICVLTLLVSAACSSDKASSVGDAGTDGSAGKGSGGQPSPDGSAGAAGSSGKGGGGTAGAGGATGGTAGTDAGKGTDAGLVSLSASTVEGVPGTLGSEPPLAGVEVCELDATGANVASVPCVTTDAKGEYTLAGLTPNTQVIVRYTKTGYEKQLSIVDVGTKDVTGTGLRMVRYLTDGGVDAGVAPNFGWDPAVVLDPKKGSMNVVALQAAHVDGGTDGTGVDFTTGVSFTVTPSSGEGPFYVAPNETWSSGATSTVGGYGAWYMNLSPGTYTINWSSKTLTCVPLPGYPYGWPQKDGSIKAPILAGYETQTVGFFCSPAPSDAGKG